MIENQSQCTHIEMHEIILTPYELDSFGTEEWFQQIKHASELREDYCLFFGVRPLIDLVEKLEHHSNLRRHRFIPHFLHFGRERNAIFAIRIPFNTTGVT